MRPKSMRCNVAILPPKKISDRAILISRKLKNNGGAFSLDKKGHFPHITLYMTDVPRKNIKNIIELLRHEFLRTRRMAFKTSFYHQKKDDFVDIGFERTAEIFSLHKSLIRLLNPLREGIKAHRERFGEFGRRERANIVRYGYPEAGALFRPHLTLTRLAPRLRSKNVVSSLPKKDFSFTATSIGFFTAGPHGTCRKIIAKFNLR